MKSTIKLKSILIIIFCYFSIKSSAQISIGSEGTILEPNTSFIFGNEWGIDDWGGFNVWRLWPYAYSGNYKFVVDSNVGLSIGDGASRIGRINVNGSIWTSGSYISYSDSRLKKHIKNLSEENCLNKLFLLQGKSYYKTNLPEQDKEYEKLITAGKITEEEVYKAKAFKDQKSILKRKEFGFLAQELKEVFPDLVSEDTQGYLFVDYLGLIPILVEAIKEQQEILNNQRVDLENALKEIESENI